MKKNSKWKFISIKRFPSSPCFLIESSSTFKIHKRTRKIQIRLSRYQKGRVYGKACSCVYSTAMQLNISSQHKSCSKYGNTLSSFPSRTLLEGKRAAQSAHSLNIEVPTPYLKESIVNQYYRYLQVWKMLSHQRKLSR